MEENWKNCIRYDLIKNSSHELQNCFYNVFPEHYMLCNLRIQNQFVAYYAVTKRDRVGKGQYSKQ